MRDHSHLSVQDLLLAADGEVGEARAQHLADCDACRARLRELEDAAAEATTAHQRSLDPWVPAPAAARARLQEGLARLSSARAPWWNSPVVWRYTAALAPVVLALLVASYYGFPGRGMQTVPVSFPEPSLTPGAVIVTDAAQVCHSSRPKNRIVPASLQRKVFAEYGIPAAEPRAYEVDYLITPALGGSDDIRNLWPQSNSSAVWNARIKDRLEDRLHDLVCDGSIDLATAQHDLAADWIAAYRKYFHTDEPLEEAR
jgi:hypothetical protein